MQSLQEVYNRMQEKKKEYKTIARGFADELKNNAKYMEIVEQMKQLREQKKSFEDQAKAAALLDASKMETLKLDIENDKETLTDIALNKYVAQEVVEIVDREAVRWEPVFSVKFQKASEAEDGLQKSIMAVETEHTAVMAKEEAESVEVVAETAEAELAEVPQEVVAETTAEVETKEPAREKIPA